jgi:hypothetical protein
MARKRIGTVNIKQPKQTQDFSLEQEFQQLIEIYNKHKVVDDNIFTLAPLTSDVPQVRYITSTDGTGE